MFNIKFLLVLIIIITLILLIINCFKKDNLKNNFNNFNNFNNLIIITTFRNKSRLLIPFYNFYKDIWKPKTFMFIIGLDNKNRLEYINNINNIFNSNFNELKKFNNLDRFYNIILYSNNYDIELLIYDIKHDFDGKYFDAKRYDLFKLMINYNKIYKYKLNTDIDDFFYVKNVPNYLINYKENKNNYFHTLEFLPHENFSTMNNFNFISNHYYFNQDKISTKSEHGTCRAVHLDDMNKIAMHKLAIDSNKDHDHICKCFDKKIKKNNFNTIEDFDRVSFSFGCLDLDFLLNEKKFNIPKIETYTKKDIFYLKYFINKEDYYKYPIIKCNFLKKYFNNYII